MIRKLQLKIILIISLILTLAVVGIMYAINRLSHASNQTEIDSRIKRIADRDGLIPHEYEDINLYNNSQSGYSDCFSVQVDFNYQIRQIVLTRDIVVQAEDIGEYALTALNSGKTSGEMGSYAYYIQNKPYGLIVVFMNITTYQQAEKNLLFTTSLIGILTILLFCGFAVGISFWLVRPVKTTLNKQKLFISNASHELKTPLAVISANTEVLSAEIGSNKWVDYIRAETVRMNELVSELLCLARLDDKNGHKLVLSDMNLSDVFLQTALPFESKAFEMGKHFEVTAQPDVLYKGDVSAIKHIITILIDNAIKYSNEHGSISASLYTHGSKRIIEVYNTGEGVPKDKLQKIFERFYRMDEARNGKSGGYGLGLPIAKATAEAHGGKINVQSEYGQWICFTVVL